MVQDIRFGERVYVSNSPLVATWLAKFSSKETGRRDFIDLLSLVFRYLFMRVVENEFPRDGLGVTTRMKERLHVTGIKADTNTVVVDILRAGIVPAWEFYKDLLQFLLVPEAVHMHHLVMSRLTDAEGKVMSTSIDDSKAQEPIRPDSIVVFVDPMLATGGTIDTAIGRYKKKYPDTISKFIVVCLIAVPDGINRLLMNHTEVVIYAGRVDRELTPESYILPGAGGVGEILMGTNH